MLETEQDRTGQQETMRDKEKTMIRQDKPSMTEEERDAVLAFISRPAFRGEVKPAEIVRLVRVANGYWTPIRKATTKSSIVLTTRRS